MRLVNMSPGHDHHSHVSLYASLQGVADISSMQASEALGFLSACPGDRLTLVIGWRSERLPLPSSVLAGLPPLVVVNFSLHGCAVTPSAMPYISALWPEFADHAHDAAWAEFNLPELFAFYSRIAGLDQAKLASYMEGLERAGIDSVEDMICCGAGALEVIRRSPYAGRVASWATPKGFADLGVADRKEIRGIKLFMDGALGARSAAVEPAFLDGCRGKLLHDPSSLDKLLADLAPHHKPLAVHAIGSRAVDQILDALDRMGSKGVDFPAIRLEHVQFITQNQALRAREKGIVLSMQPNFNSDSLDYRDRLPESLLAANDPFRMLIDEAGFRPGVDLIFGSDGMPHGLEYALQWSLFPHYPGQELSVEELAAGYRAQAGAGRDLIFEVDEVRRTVRALPHDRP